MIIAPIASNPKRVTAGGLVVISCETRTNAGVLTTPGTSISIIIYGPGGATDQTSASMTTGSTGIHTYTYQTVTTKPSGERTVEIIAVHTDGSSRVRSVPGDACNFEVV